MRLNNKFSHLCKIPYFDSSINITWTCFIHRTKHLTITSLNRSNIIVINAGFTAPITSLKEEENLDENSEIKFIAKAT